MPLFYKDGVLAEHNWVRSHTGLFDVSHMGQIILEGPECASFLEKITPSAFQPKSPGRAQYTVLLNPEGGIIDDLIISRLDTNTFFAVINAGCKEKDIAWIKDHLPNDLQLNHLSDRSLLALQGREAEGILKTHWGIDLSEVPYMHTIETEIEGVPAFISRLGYTGEDGFEISIPNNKATAIWETLCGDEHVKPIGLAARDSLRLEMGYPLYGHDIDHETSPIEAGLPWIISKKTSGYFGYDRIQKELNGSPTRQLCGFKLLDRGIAREGAEIYTPDGQEIGTVTSGGHSPTLNASIGQGYIDKPYANLNEIIHIDIRGKRIHAEIVPRPFIAPKTKSMKKNVA